MALTYTWKVTGLKKKDQVNSEGATLSGAVVQTYWEAEGTDENGDTAKFSGATPFSAENVPAGTFVAFEDLTEEVVTGWIRNVVDADPTYGAHIEERIRAEINKGVVTDITESGLPWSDGSSVTPDPLAIPSAEEESANTAE